MDDQQLLRYSRHILLDEIGIEGQNRLSEAHAVIVGAGGLGSAAAFYLTSAGIGQITLIDHDQVDLTNLQRQILHTEQSIGLGKVESGKRTLQKLNPHVQINAIAERLDASHIDAWFDNADIVLDCTDNFATRHLINASCVRLQKPLVSGAAIRFDAQCTVFDLRAPSSPCYACLFPPQLNYEEVACATMGVFAPLVGIVGSIQAAEAIKLILSIGTTLAGRLLLLDARTMSWQSIEVSRDPGCSVCGTAHR